METVTKTRVSTRAKTLVAAGTIALFAAAVYAFAVMQLPGGPIFANIACNDLSASLSPQSIVQQASETEVYTLTLTNPNVDPRCRARLASISITLDTNLPKATRIASLAYDTSKRPQSISQYPGTVTFTLASGTVVVEPKGSKAFKILLDTTGTIPTTPLTKVTMTVPAKGIVWDDSNYTPVRRMSPLIAAGSFTNPIVQRPTDCSNLTVSSPTVPTPVLPGSDILVTKFSVSNPNIATACKADIRSVAIVLNAPSFPSTNRKVTLKSGSKTWSVDTNIVTAPKVGFALPAGALSIPSGQLAEFELRLDAADAVKTPGATVQSSLAAQEGIVWRDANATPVEHKVGVTTLPFIQIASPRCTDLAAVLDPLSPASAKSGSASRVLSFTLTNNNDASLPCAANVTKLTFPFVATNFPLSGRTFAVRRVGSTDPFDFVWKTTLWADAGEASVSIPSGAGGLQIAQKKSARFEIFIDAAKALPGATFEIKAPQTTWTESNGFPHSLASFKSAFTKSVGFVVAGAPSCQPMTVESIELVRSADNLFPKSYFAQIPILDIRLTNPNAPGACDFSLDDIAARLDVTPLPSAPDKFPTAFSLQIKDNVNNSWLTVSAASPTLKLQSSTNSTEVRGVLFPLSGSGTTVPGGTKQEYRIMADMSGVATGNYLTKAFIPSVAATITSVAGPGGLRYHDGSKTGYQHGQDVVGINYFYPKAQVP